jgi:hypothetical protein
VIVQRGMLPLPWLPPGVWHRSPGSTLALHGGEHPAPFYWTASECRYYKCLSCRWSTYTKCIFRLNQETRRRDFFICVFIYQLISIVRKLQCGLSCRYDVRRSLLTGDVYQSQSGHRYTVSRRYISFKTCRR